jgi:hypothetical protein
MAVPSAKNSGLDKMSNRTLPLEFASRIARIDSAVRQGTVDFSITILELVANSAMRRVAVSTYLRGTKTRCDEMTAQKYPKRLFFSLEVSRHASTNAFHLGGSIDTDKDHVCFYDGTVHIGGEEQISIATLEYDFLKTRLINWKGAGIPRINSRLRNVADCYFDVRTLQSNDCTSKPGKLINLMTPRESMEQSRKHLRRTTHISSPNAANLDGKVTHRHPE